MNYKIINEPLKHVIIDTKKEIHGWYPGKRECTAERMLINPYNGCSIGCFYCYARALPGYFELFQNGGNLPDSNEYVDPGTIFVSRDYDKIIAEQLDSIDIATCGYLSPVTDPFQELDKKYLLSEKIIKVFIERNIPIEFITKSKIPDSVIDLIKGNKYSFGQVSILTTDENIRKILVPNGENTNELFNNIKRLADNNIFAVCRIDPIFPYITDDKKQLKNIVNRAIDSGAKHIISSIVDIPVKISYYILNNIKKYFGTSVYYDYKNLYTEKIGYMNAKIDYRKKIFDYLRNLCDSLNITFALCMEYEIIEKDIENKQKDITDEKTEVIGLNRIFMSSVNCEGIDIPVHIKGKDNKFYPATDCSGNCLNCIEPKCGINDLAMGRINSKKDWKLKDYRRWSKEIRYEKLPL